MRIGYFLSEAVTNFRRNLLMTIAAISTVAISLLLLGGVLILGHTINNMTDDWEREVEVQVFLRKNVSTGEESAVRDDLSQMREVKGIDYVSKEEALEEFARDYPDFAESLPPGSLPASYKVELTDAKFAEEVAARIRGSGGVETVKFGGSVVKTLLQVNSLLRAVTFVMSGILMVAAVALIANTIRLAIYARREEIGIMKLVGATNWFIRVPFMLEGVFAALLGAVVSIVVVIGIVKLLFTALGERFLFLQNPLSFSTGELMGVVLLLAAVGGAVGLAGSYMAVRRFLQV
ncbi:MAG: permease-like cell division protein FtsX [Actinomycetota bacterium]